MQNRNKSIINLTATYGTVKTFEVDNLTPGFTICQLQHSTFSFPPYYYSFSEGAWSSD